jgi:hypothetical protein
MLRALVVSGVSLLLGQGVAPSAQIAERTIPLTPHVPFVQASFLTGALQDSRVAGRVDPGSGTVVGTPVLQADLTVTNDSEHQAARPLWGEVRGGDASW